ncbi:glycosyltransferase [Bacillus sp. EAC]|uniref:glycosyltransferase n=1 Tax=Bacillus sp. EAC TaxID=1978338 RepID=UPI000B43A235|nr:glycosyltransferase [Bacillus sp. EAC]
MEITERNINVVTVTYGDRWEYLREIINRVCSFDEVTSVIIVDNNSSYSVKEYVKGEFDKFSERIIVISSEVNLGSAGGFKKGIERSLQEKGSLVWLLDDDNLPSENSIEHLKEAAYKLENQDNYILCLYRKDWKELLKNKGQKLNMNSFFQFSIVSKIKKLMSKYSNKQNIKKDEFEVSDLLNLDYAPYGGLIFPKEIVSEIGLPNEDFYLYVDDTEFTYRMTKSGYKIYCVVNSTITDLESSWFRKKHEPMFLSFFKTEHSYRGLMNIRNRVYFEKKYNTQSSIIYFANMVTYLVFVLFIYMPKNKNGFKKYLSIIKSIRQGYEGKLGKDIR